MQLNVFLSKSRIPRPKGRACPKGTPAAAAGPAATGLGRAPSMAASFFSSGLAGAGAAILALGLAAAAAGATAAATGGWGTTAGLRMGMTPSGSNGCPTMQLRQRYVWRHAWRNTTRRVLVHTAQGNLEALDSSHRSLEHRAHTANEADALTSRSIFISETPASGRAFSQLIHTSSDAMTFQTV